MFLCVSRRIAYQEASQTFGVISMRTDISESSGGSGAGPIRPSASTQAQTISSSTGSSVAKPLGISSASGGDMNDFVCGDEQEVHSLLVIDQHTFEGLYIDQHTFEGLSIVHLWKM